MGGQTNSARAPIEPNADRATRIAEIAHIANENLLITLATITAHGWPNTHCMHFSIDMEHAQPRVYMFTHDATRKLANIAAQPRVSLGIYAFGPGGSDRLVLELQGLCTEIISPAEHAAAMETHFVRPGYEFARFMSMQYQPGLRVDVARATLFGPTGPILVDFPAAG